MAAPQFIEEKPLALTDVKATLEEISKRDEELNYLSNKAREHLEQLELLSQEEKAKLHKKLVDLNLTRLKEEHIAKIVDFLPQTADDLKVVLQGYPVSMPKKDNDAIVKTVAEFT